MVRFVGGRVGREPTRLVSFDDDGRHVCLDEQLIECILRRCACRVSVRRGLPACEQGSRDAIVSEVPALQEAERSGGRGPRRCRGTCRGQPEHVLNGRGRHDGPAYYRARDAQRHRWAKRHDDTLKPRRAVNRLFVWSVGRWANMCGEVACSEALYSKITAMLMRLSMLRFSCLRRGRHGGTWQLREGVDERRLRPELGTNA